MGELAGAVAVAAVAVEGVEFPPYIRPPGTDKTLFLAGAGVREVEIPGGRILKVTTIGVYLEESALRSLAGQWAGKTPAELAAEAEFYRNIYSGEFDKLSRITMLLPLTGEQYAGKVSENCAAQWEAAGANTEDRTAALEEFKKLFQPETFPPGASILFFHHSSGVTVSFMKEGAFPEASIECKALSEAILESIIGERGVSPGAKQSIAQRLPELLKNLTPLAGDEVEPSEPVPDTTEAAADVNPAEPAAA